MALLTNLKTYREKYNLKQADLAELVGVRRETIVNLERGKYNPSLKLAMDIARVFHTTVEELFQYTDEQGLYNRPNRTGAFKIPSFTCKSSFFLKGFVHLYLLIICYTTHENIRISEISQNGGRKH